MRTFVAAAAVSLGLASAAQAATYQAVFTGLQNNNGALSALGAEAGATTMTFTWDVDETAAPLSGPYTYRNSYYNYYEYSYVYLPYESFTVSVGGVSLSGDPSNSTNDFIFVRDGTRDGRYNIYDQFQVYSDVNIDLSNGWVVDFFRFYAYDYDETLLSGLDHPTVSEISSLDYFMRGEIRLYNAASGTYAHLFSQTAPTITEISAVPLPAGAPLLIGGLAALGLIRRRKRG